MPQSNLNLNQPTIAYGSGRRPEIPQSLTGTQTPQGARGIVTSLIHRTIS